MLPPDSLPCPNLCYSGDEYTTFAMDAHSEDSVKRRLSLVPVCAAVVLASALLLPAAPKPGNTQTAKASAKKVSAKPAPAATVPQISTITVDGVADIDPTKAFGSKNAPVVMEVFSDFQCPACKQLFTTTTQRVLDNYVNSGKVYLVHRDFPLPMHAYSRVAANYSRAAAHIGKCDAVEQVLFRNQEKWEADGKVKETVASVLTPAEMKKVEALVDSKSLEPLVERDRQLGQGYAVNQTPTSVLHTKSGQSYPVVGFVSYDVLKTLLDQLVK